jgi:hypothetical protein|tara:strand:- start:257 stop:613 length:357 start_codon:yes stop_codon:yes gene_type:complete
MRKTIYANEKHQQAIETYLLMCKEFAKETSTKVRYQNYLEVLDLILEYHNSYGAGTKEHNFFDWLMIIPINVSVATNGYFAALETKGNRAILRAYKVVLDEMLQDTVGKIDTIEPEDD